MEQDLINRVKLTTKANDYSGHNDGPDKVRSNRDKERQQQQHRKKRKQKNFSKEDPHIDLQV